MNFLEKLHHPENYVKAFFRWSVLGILMGVTGGVLGAVFHHALHFVTHVRLEHMWLIFLLPLGGLATVALYRLPPLRDNRGTNEIIDAALHGNSISPAVAVAIFLSTNLTHLFGGSAGREGAALQLGGSVACLLAKPFRLQGAKRRILIMAGMSAVFAGLFGTPLTAVFFCMEFGSVGTIFSPALLPCYTAAYIASQVSGALGVHAETFLLETTMAMNVANGLRLVALAMLVSLLGICMCWNWHKAEHLARDYIPNPYLRIALGGCVLIGMTLLAGDHRFNGAGMDMALEAVAGHADWYSFLVKVLFTAVTLAAGFKGGEIVPTFCVGATFGCLMGGLLGLDPGICGALGLVGLFCCVTNSPLAAIMLSVEMFGPANLYLFALVCVICFVLSGNSSLYSSQVIEYSKTTAPGDAQWQ